MWNNRKLGGSPFLEAYENLLITYGTDYLKVRHNNIDDAALSRFFGSADYRTARFPNHQTLNRAGLQARVLSSSYMPHPEHPRHAPMLAELARIFDAHHGADRVTL